MDRIDVLIAHHSRGTFAAPYPTTDADIAQLTVGYIAARIVFWLTLGGVVGLVYGYGWLVR